MRLLNEGASKFSDATIAIGFCLAHIFALLDYVSSKLIVVIGTLYDSSGGGVNTCTVARHV